MTPRTGVQFSQECNISHTANNASEVTQQGMPGGVVSKSLCSVIVLISSSGWLAARDHGRHCNPEALPAGLMCGPTWSSLPWRQAVNFRDHQGQYSDP